MTTFIVNTLKDENNGLVLGKVSLRDAIVAASSNPGSDKIIFDKSLRKGTINLTYGSLEIFDDLIITGPGANLLTISDGRESIFNIDSLDGQSGLRVNIQGLTLQNTKKQPAIVNTQKLTLTNCTISNNNGAINNKGIVTVNNCIIANNKNTAVVNSGTLSINRSTISGNTSNSKGAGIYNTGILTVSNSSITGNTITNGNGGGGINNRGFLRLRRSRVIANNAGYGGGINNGGRLSINDTTISANTAYNGGGGLANTQNVNITGTTFDSNVTKGKGGALYNSGKLNLVNTTISGNSAKVAGGGLYNSNISDFLNVTLTKNSAPKGRGSGIVSFDSGFNNPSATLSNTIVSGNLNTDIDFLGQDNTITSYGGNVVGFGSAQTAFRKKSDQNGVKDPKLRRLANNGGLTRTHALRPDSMAVDRGSDSLVPKNLKSDQRGQPRIQGKKVDVGAYELKPAITEKQSQDLLTLRNTTKEPKVGNLDMIQSQQAQDDLLQPQEANLITNNFLAKQFNEDYREKNLTGLDISNRFASLRENLPQFNLNNQNNYFEQTNVFLLPPLITNANFNFY